MLNIYSTGLLCIRLAARQSGLSAAASLPRSERFGQIGVPGPGPKWHESKGFGQACSERGPLRRSRDLAGFTWV